MSNEELNAYNEDLPEELTAAAAARDSHEDDLLAVDGVVGVGLGYSDDDSEAENLVVLVTSQADVDSASVPSEIDGVPTTIVEVGELVAGDTLTDTTGTTDADLNFEDDVDESLAMEMDPQALRKKMRPMRPGCSIGHYKVTAGTFGAGAYDINAAPGIPKRFYALSNNHVLANSNNASIGDPVLQPGRYDGGRNTDAVGKLVRFVPIRFNGSKNYVDAAIATVPFHDMDRDIFWSGYPSKAAGKAKPQMIVKKTGRTTSFTTGRVTAVGATVNVRYGRQVAKFARQIVTTRMSAPGDSGSLLLNLDNEPIGLLFAGSSQATIHNPIAAVQKALKIRIWP